MLSPPSRLGSGVRLQAVALCLLLAASAVPAGAVLADDATVDRQSDAVSFEQVDRGNLFYANETPAVVVQSDAKRVVWTVEAYGGERVGNGSLAIADDGEATLSLPVHDVGHYEIRAWPAGATESVAKTTTSILPADDFEHDDEFYGMMAGLSDKESRPGFDMLDLMDHIGVESARQQVDWHEVERRRGVFDFAGSKYGGIGEEMAATDIEWYVTAGFGNPVYGGEWNTAPYNASYRAAYAEYVRATLGQYDFRQVEVWNEYNHAPFAAGPAGEDPEAYYRLLERTYAAVKAEDPSVAVLGGSTTVNRTSGNRIDWGYWEALLERGGADYMDAMTIHPYRERPTGIRADFARLRNLTRKHNDGEALPIWVSENGYSTDPDGVLPSTQARYTVISHARFAAADVERVYWYTLEDPDAPQHDVSWDQAGMLRHAEHPTPNAPKPALNAYATMTRQLAGLDHRRVETAPVHVNSHVYGTGANETRVLWASLGAGAADVTLHTDERVTLTTVTGETQRLVPRDGEVYLTVGEDPLYVRGQVEKLTRGTPVSLDGTGTTLRAGYESDGTGPGSVTHVVDGRSVETSAGDSRSFSLPTAYRPLRPSGAETFYLDGGHRVVDTVTVDGEPVGRLTTRVRPAAVSPTVPTDTPAETQPPTRTEATDDPGSVGDPTAPTDATTTTPGTTGSTTSGSGPGFGFATALATLVGIALLAWRRRE